jgi:hypothetical protein
MSAAVSRNRRPLLGLLALFAAPLAVSFWLYYGTGWRPTTTTNQGELISPAVALPVVPRPPATGPGHGDTAGSLFNSRWSLVVLAPAACAAECQQALIYTRQTALSLGRLSARLQRVLLAPGNCCDSMEFARLHPDLIRVDGSALLGTFPADDREHMVFVVDPLGNLMMRYDIRRDPKGLREDLKHLLDLSQIG